MKYCQISLNKPLYVICKKVSINYWKKIIHFKKYKISLLFESGISKTINENILHNLCLLFNLSFVKYTKYYYIKTKFIKYPFFAIFFNLEDINIKENVTKMDNSKKKMQLFEVNLTLLHLINYFSDLENKLHWRLLFSLFSENCVNLFWILSNSSNLRNHLIFIIISMFFLWRFFLIIYLTFFFHFLALIYTYFKLLYFCLFTKYIKINANY